MLTKTEKSNENNKTLPATKLILLFVVGIFGLYIFALIAGQIVKAIPGLNESQANGVSNFITYSLIAVSMLAILNKDLIKLKYYFKDAKIIIYGIIIGFLLLAIQGGYSNLVNLYYHGPVSDNETSLRSFISYYPAFSIIFLCFIGPFCEELTYRVGLFGFLSRYKVLAYIVSILIFAFMHFNPASENIINELINLPIYLFCGIILTVAYDKFGLTASLTAHCINNLYSVITILIIQNLH